MRTCSSPEGSEKVQPNPFPSRLSGCRFTHTPATTPFVPVNAKHVDGCVDLMLHRRFYLATRSRRSTSMVQAHGGGGATSNEVAQPQQTQRVHCLLLVFGGHEGWGGLEAMAHGRASERPGTPPGICNTHTQRPSAWGLEAAVQGWGSPAFGLGQRRLGCGSSHTLLNSAVLVFLFLEAEGASHCTHCLIQGTPVVTIDDTAVHT